MSLWGGKLSRLIFMLVSENRIFVFYFSAGEEMDYRLLSD